MLDYDVVIIDSGINLLNGTTPDGICIENTNNGIVYTDNLKDDFGHGTVIYSIISKKIDFSKVFIIKLSECKDIFGGECLIAALEYVKKHIRCRIVNISLGVVVSENLNRLYEICGELTKDGVIIVSAFDNDGCYSYPAAFDCVIGVDSKNDLSNINEYAFVENSPINILAKGNLQRITLQDGKSLLVGGSSVACAHISSILIENKMNFSNIVEALAYLNSKAKFIYSSLKTKKQITNVLFDIKSAIVFPFSKEMHSLLRFSHMLPFNVVNYYDIRQSGKVGVRLSDYYEEIKSNQCIMDIEGVDFENVDTIILGHLDKLNAITKRDYKAELIKKAVDSGINIYSFDSLEPYSGLIDNSDIRCFYPRVTLNDVPNNSFGKLYKISKPVLGIFGTSSQQGKFSLQISLKRELELLGYDVGTIGTEPQSLLFDFDFSFPMGYNSTVSINNSEIILYLNNIINKLCIKEKDIVLVSSQAQTIPYYCNNLLEFPSMQYHFALGTKPDVIVLCINYYDEVAYIMDCYTVSRVDKYPKM